MITAVATPQAVNQVRFPDGHGSVSSQVLPPSLVPVRDLFNGLNPLGFDKETIVIFRGYI